MSKPIEPSPTPWDFSTWGFYCDDCEAFFDLQKEGSVLMQDGNTCTYQHKCGHPARYIGYDRNQQNFEIIHQCEYGAIIRILPKR